MILLRSISLWDLTKKKPIFSHAFAHGIESRPVVSAEEGSSLGGAGTRHAGMGGSSKKAFSTSTSSVYNSEGEIRSPRAIVSIACLPYGDVFASGEYNFYLIPRWFFFSRANKPSLFVLFFSAGSHDGSIKIWSLSSSLRNFTQLFEIPVTGFINSLQLISPSKSKWERGEVLQISNWPSNRIETSGISQRSIMPKNGKKIKFSSPNSDSDSDAESEEDSMDLDSRTDNLDSINKPSHSFSNQLSLSLPLPTGASRAQAQHAPPLLIAAVGQEHRLGRWQRIKEARNLVMVVPLIFSEKRREQKQGNEGED